MLNLVVLGSILASIWRRFGVLLAHGSDSENSENLRFLMVFCYFGGLGWLVEASWASS